MEKFKQELKILKGGYHFELTMALSKCISAVFIVFANTYYMYMENFNIVRLRRLNRKNKTGCCLEKKKKMLLHENRRFESEISRMLFE